MKIIAKEIVGSNAISMQSGKLLYEKISKQLFAGEEIEIDFNGVELFASPFFNASIGFLIKDINVTELQKRLKLTNLSDVGRHLLNHVIANAILFYAEQGKAADDMQIISKNAEGQ